MSREDVSFKTTDGVTLRGWFYTATSSASGKSACIVLHHGFSALKEMDLDIFAEYFTKRKLYDSRLQKYVQASPSYADITKLSCLVYDNRGFGSSDVASGAPRQEILPYQQCSDLSDAITYAQSRSEVDANKIGIWGSSYSGGNVLWVGSKNRRVKAVLSQAPCVDGWANFHRLIRPDFIAGLNDAFQADRHARAAGKEPARLPVVDENPMAPSALPTPDSFEFFTAWGKKSEWKNEVTVRSIEAFRGYNPAANIHRISPTPLLMTVAYNDVLTPTDLAIEAFSRAREPKELHILPGGHFEAYSGPNFEKNAERQLAFLRKTLCA